LLLQGLANLPLMLKASEELWVCGLFDGEQFDGWRGQSEGLNGLKNQVPFDQPLEIGESE